MAQSDDTNSKRIQDFIEELKTLPPNARISIEIWDTEQDDWSIAKPEICEDKDRPGRFVISYLPEPKRAAL